MMCFDTHFQFLYSDNHKHYSGIALVGEDGVHSTIMCETHSDLVEELHKEQVHNDNHHYPCMTV